MRRPLVGLAALFIVFAATVFAGAGDAAQDDDWGDDPWADEGSEPAVHGFVELGLGGRTADDQAIARDLTIGELRVRLESEWEPARVRFSVKGDLAYDEVLGEGQLDLRELALSFSPTARTDLKLGPQVLTWGTGDFVFLNDLFAKDFESFFSGRDDEYLKGAESAVRFQVHAERLSWDLVWAPPLFEPDEYLDGERFSFYLPSAGAIGAPNPPLHAVTPSRTLDNGELSLRVFRERAGVEYAAYLHHGFFQQPRALDAAGRPSFAPLAAAGASVRGSWLGGLSWAEAAFYGSRDDRGGVDPRLPNDQLRILLGHERELARNLTASFQYNVEWTLDHDELLAASPDPAIEPDERRHLVTWRLTRLLSQQRWTLSSFVFWSPTDRDLYWRASCRWRIDDRWSAVAGLNVFEGRRAHTFFGQLDGGDNLFVRVRRSF